MQGVHAFEPQAKSSIDLETFVAEDHFLRRIDRILDLSFVRELTAPRYAADQGRPSIDPEVYFRMQLVAYFYGIAKDRRLCEEVRYNLAYRWFCRLSLEDDVPDHSSLTRIRDRLGEEVFEAVFRRIVAQCEQKELVKEHCRVMTDATLIAADASLNSLVHNDPEQAEAGKEEAQRERRGSIDGSSATQAIEPNSPQPHRPGCHAVRRSEAEPLPRASESTGATQSADPGLPAQSCRTSNACSSHFIAGYQRSTSSETPIRNSADRQTPHVQIEATKCQQKSDFFNRPGGLLAQNVNLVGTTTLKRCSSIPLQPRSVEMKDPFCRLKQNVERPPAGGNS